MSVKKTIRRRTKRTLYEANRPSDSLKSSTMPIPIEEVFEDIPLANESYVQVNIPEQEPIKVKLDEGEIDLGRDESCRICLPLSNVSRRHARLFRKGEDYVVEDLDSTNGTFVNGVKVCRCVLHNNDHIRIGEARILFVQERIRRKA